MVNSSIDEQSNTRSYSLSDSGSRKNNDKKISLEEIDTSYSFDRRFQIEFSGRNWSRRPFVNQMFGEVVVPTYLNSKKI